MVDKVVHRCAWPWRTRAFWPQSDRSSVAQRLRSSEAGGRDVKKAFGICGLLGLMVLPADGGQGLSVKVSPVKSFAPSSLRVIARIEPSITNRSLTLIADGENFYRSSAFPLEGDQAPKIIDMQFPNLPSGEYRIVAVVTDAGGHERAVAHDAATVLSVDGQ
jgi:hypothetical protein